MFKHPNYKTNYQLGSKAMQVFDIEMLVKGENFQK